VEADDDDVILLPTPEDAAPTELLALVNGVFVTPGFAKASYSELKEAGAKWAFVSGAIVEFLLAFVVVAAKAAASPWTDVPCVFGPSATDTVVSRCFADGSNDTLTKTLRTLRGRDVHAVLHLPDHYAALHFKHKERTLYVMDSHPALRADARKEKRALRSDVLRERLAR